MLLKKSIAILIIFLVLTLVLTACAGKTQTTTSAPTTAAAASTTVTKTTTTVAATTASPVSTTAVSAIPVLSVDDVSSITLDSALLRGSIKEGQGIDQRGFDWGTTSGNYQSSSVDKGIFNTGTFDHQVTGLNEGTTYYFRSKAHSTKGWGYSQEKSFRTLGIPKITSVTANSALQGKTVAVTLTGVDFTDASAVSLGDGVTVKNFTVSNDTKIIVNISIAANAAPGPRTVLVTNPNGTGTLPGGFTVNQVSIVKHTTIWSDSQFTDILHLLTAGSANSYQIHFHDNSQMTVVTATSVNVGVEVRDGKISFTRVPQSLWGSVFSAGSQYMSYDSASQVITINTFPDTVLQTKFDVPLATMPGFSTIIAVETRITITYNREEVI